MYILLFCVQLYDIFYFIVGCLYKKQIIGHIIPYH